MTETASRADGPARPKSGAELLYVACFLALLVGVQVRAEVLQVVRGYRPLTHTPGRVPFSWDMFTTHIERCDISWTPPLEVDGAKVSRWSDRTKAIEFDTVYDREVDYQLVAAQACAFRSKENTRASLACALPTGEVVEEIVPCP